MTTTVTSRFLKTFSFFSLLCFLFLSVFRFFFSNDFANFEIYKYIAVFFSVVLTYVNIFPYILSFSLYRAFFYYENNGGDTSLLKVSQRTIIIVAVMFALYTSVVIFFSSGIARNIHNIYVSQEYIYLHKSKKDKSIEYLTKAREAFAERDYVKSIRAIEEGLAFLPDDEDLIIYLKHVINQKQRDEDLMKSSSDLEAERKYMLEAIDAYSHSDYDNAKRLLLHVLSINDENGMAKFYLNKIALELGEKNSLFTQQEESEVLLYKKISEGISLYNGGEYWRAYNIFRTIYVENPYHYEVVDYYNLAMSKIKMNDFFITDAEFLYEIFVDKASTSTSKRKEPAIGGIFNKLYFPIDYDSVCDIEFLKLSENTYLYTTVLNIFNETYFFDTVLISTHDGEESYTRYRYGKLTSSLKSGVSDIILKGKYDSSNTYNKNDLDYKILTVSTPPNLFTVAKDIDATDFISAVDMATLLEYMPDFGFDRAEILSTLMYKMFLPLEVLLIAVVISYYSMRYRKKHDVHVVHMIVGFFGSVFLTFMIVETFALALDVLSIVSGRSYMGFIIFALITIAFIVAYSIQFFRVKIDEPE